MINFIATFAAIVFLYLLAEDFFVDKQKSLATVLIFLFFPTALFLTVFYTEALFCALSFGAFYFARRRYWALSCVFLAFLTATRITSLAVAAAVFVEYLVSTRGKLFTKDLAWFLLAPLGLLIYSVYLYKKLGDPLLFKNAYRYGWTERNNPNLNILLLIYQKLRVTITQLAAQTGEWKEGTYDGLLFMGSWFLALGLGIVGYFKKLPASYLFLIGASLLLFIYSGTFDSVNRYILPLFPIYLVLADLANLQKRPWLLSLYLGCSALLLGLFATLFANGYWIG